MLWNLPGSEEVSVVVEGSVVKVEVLAELPGAAFLQTKAPSPNATNWFKQVDRELAKRFPERLIRFQHPKEDSWFWPKKLASGSLSYERLLTGHNQLPDYLAQRLAGLSFSPKDHQTPGAINPVAVKEKIRGQFESSKITSNFFKKFKERHELLSTQMIGIPSTAEASSYSTLLLNRLMFIYFLQKKEFLNGDPNYLKTCLRKVQTFKGKDKFYSFYKDYLLELFFNKLDNPVGEIEDPIIREIAGDVPYVNGGVFGRSAAESQYDIKIPDSAFEDIFNFFDSYTWHLDTRPTGTPNEINPEVIGYIFEQYINFTADGKRENGAYYTKHDVTGYMVGQTLVPRILDEVLKLDLDPFALLMSNPDNYLYEPMKHGWNSEQGVWKPIDQRLVDCWQGDPIGWTLLDEAETDSEVCLPDETWVETFARRERVQELRDLMLSGQVKDVNKLITLNLNSERLLSDAIFSIDEIGEVESLWYAVSGLKVIDPTCGSGAFLFAALEVLEVVYGNLIDRLEALGKGSKILQEMSRHPNRRYFLRKHSALRNLFGTDIMSDAIETAKLRIFLALASCLEKKADLEPLPDLDFNLKVGNLVVGFVDAKDVSRVDNGRLIVENPMANLEGAMAHHLELYDDFIAASVTSGSDAIQTKSRLLASEHKLRSAANNYYAECTGKSLDEYESWAKEVLPFHWSIEFPSVFSNGGFDVVIGNPPYITKSEVPKATRQALIGFETQDLPDFYAVCLERANQLRNNESRKAMIVMLSFAFSPAFEKLRAQSLARRQESVWISTFGKRPDALFRGVQVVNTILCIGPGSEKFAASHQIFNTSKRNWMFELLQYHSLALTDAYVPIRAGLVTGLATKFAETIPGLRAQDGAEIYLRPTGRYWMPVLPARPPVLSSRTLEIVEPNDSRVNVVNLFEGEEPKMVLALLAGKLGFLWWSAIGDDFHTMVSQTIPPRRLLVDRGDSKRLLELANEVLDKAHSAVFGSKNAGAVYVNIRWTDLSRELDAFARQLLIELNLLDYWRPLNIWYRMTMRSGGENSNSVAVQTEIAKALTTLG
jgi:type I restriction-modification system DNA methylase subunit